MEEPAAHPDHTPPYASAAPSDTLGTRHIEVALQDLPFPATREQVLERAGLWRVPITGDRQVPLGELLKGVPEQRFRDAAHVANAVAKAHPEMRKPQHKA